MDFTLAAEQRAWRDRARDFAQGTIRPQAAALDRAGEFPDAIVAEMARRGFLGLTLPPEWGGSGGDTIAYCLVLEELARADAGIAITVEAHISLGCAPLVAFGTTEQRARFLPALASGARLWAFGLTEAGAGTDAGGTATVATLDDRGWTIDGAKRYITNGGTPRTAGVTVLARTGTRPDGRPELSTLLVPQETPSYTRGPAHETLGWRTANQVPLGFAACRVPADHLLGPRGAGLRQFLQILDGGRIAVGALAVGLAQACLDEALDHARRRHQFGRAIGGFQAIQLKLADMATEIESARGLVLRAAWLKDRGEPFGREASMAKVFASEAAKRAADNAAQILGGAGFLAASAVARYWRQVKINEIGEGTSEINRQIIARGLLADADALLAGIGTDHTIEASDEAAQTPG